MSRSFRLSDAHHTADSTFERVALDLQHRPFPELATALRERAYRIIARWRVLSLKAMPHLDRITLAEFETSISKVLSSITDAIESEDPQRLRGIIEQVPSHGLDRFIQSFGLLDYFEEQRILRGVVVLETGEALRRPMNVGEAATFHALFDIIIQQGAIAMVQKQKEQAQRQVENELQESQRFLRSSLDAIAGHIAVLDESGVILEVNESWRRFAGENKYVGAGYGVGSNYFNACDQPDCDCATDADRDRMTGDGAAIANGIREVIAHRRDGFEAEYPCHSPTRQRWFIMRATRFQGPGPVRVVIVHDDVTERRLSEAARDGLAEQFAEHSRQFDRLLSSIADFAYTFDLDGCFTFANKPLLDLWELPMDEVVGKNFLQLKYPAELAAKLTRQVLEVIDSRQSIVDETPYVTPSGQEGYYQYIFSPVIGNDDRVVAVAGSTRNIPR